MRLQLCFLLLPLVFTNGISFQIIDKNFQWCYREKDHCIIGGKEVKKNAYPFMVRINVKFVNGDYSLCGGTLLTPQWVMTAAHCVKYNRDIYKIYNVTVHVGDHHFYFKDPTEQIIRAQKIKIHPKYAEVTANDIALIKLQRKAKLSRAVQCACLSPRGSNYVGRRARVIGWGLTASDSRSISPVLKETDVPILPSHKCFLNDSRDKDKLCIGFMNRLGHGTAFMGDSGGPLFVRNCHDKKITIVGIVAHGPVLHFFRPTILFAIYTKVSHYINWIRSETGTSSICISK